MVTGDRLLGCLSKMGWRTILKVKRLISGEQESGVALEGPGVTYSKPGGSKRGFFIPGCFPLFAP